MQAEFQLLGDNAIKLLHKAGLIIRPYFCSIAAFSSPLVCAEASTRGVRSHAPARSPPSVTKHLRRRRRLPPRTPRSPARLLQCWGARGHRQLSPPNRGSCSDQADRVLDSAALMTQRRHLPSIMCGQSSDPRVIRSNIFYNKYIINIFFLL